MSVVLAALLTVAPALPPAVLRVGPTQPFATIAQALAVASAGDLILVDPGTYANFVVTMPVTVAASSVSFVVTQGINAAAIKIVGAGGTVAIDGAQINLNTSNAPAIDVNGCTGDVRLQNIYVDTSTNLVNTSARAAIQITNCADVLFERVDVYGATARSGSTSLPDGVNNGLSAVRFEDTQFVLNGCTLRGYDAPSGAFYGGDAVRVVTSGVFQPHSCWLLATLGSQTLIGGASSGNGGNCFHRIGNFGVVAEFCLLHFFVPGTGGVLAGGVNAVNNNGGVVGGYGSLIPACVNVLATFTTAPSVATVGSTFHVSVNDIYGGGTCILMMGFGGTYQHSLPGIYGRVLLDLSTAVQIGTAPSPATFPITIPNNPIFAGLHMTAQSVVMSPSGTTAIVSSTPALVSVR